MNKLKNIFKKIKDFLDKTFRIKKPGVIGSLIGKCKAMFKGNKLGVLLVVLAVILGALYYFRGSFIAATVNGQPISRFEIIKRLETTGGKDALENAITEVLVIQEAKKLNALATKADIDTEIAKVREEIAVTGQTLEAILLQQGVSAKDFEERIKLQKTVEKILEAKSAVTEEEISAFIEANKSAIPEGMQQDELRSLVKEQLKSQKLTNEFQTWLDMVKAKSNINYLIKY